MKTTAKETAHTPTPWMVACTLENGLHTDIKIVSEDQDILVRHDDWKGPDNKEAVENAAFIVKAVNSHEALLEAAEHYSICGFRNAIDCSQCAKAENTIEKAEGK